MEPYIIQRDVAMILLENTLKHLSNEELSALMKLVVGNKNYLVVDDINKDHIKTNNME